MCLAVSSLFTSILAPLPLGCQVLHRFPIGNADLCENFEENAMNGDIEIDFGLTCCWFQWHPLLLSQSRQGLLTCKYREDNLDDKQDDKGEDCDGEHEGRVMLYFCHTC